MPSSAADFYLKNSFKMDFESHTSKIVWRHQSGEFCRRESHFLKMERNCKKNINSQFLTPQKPESARFSGLHLLAAEIFVSCQRSGVLPLLPDAATFGTLFEKL
jgi:hypothetical protein